MKFYHAFIVTCLLGTLSAQLFPQKLDVGFASGLNLSDIHGNDIYGLWKTKPGPAVGLFADYNLTPTIGLHTGVDYSTVYYEHHPYEPWYSPINYYPMNSIMPFYPQMSSSNFSFLTLPLMVTVTIPSKPSLTLGAGGYYSFTMDQDLDFSYYYIDDDESMRNDLGYVYMLRLNYPLQKGLDLFLRGRYLTGRRTMAEGVNYRHGYSDIAAGLLVRIGKDKSVTAGENEDSGVVNENIFLTWHAGVVTSWNSGNIDNDKYSPLVAPSAGFSVNFRLSGTNTWFRTGVTLERQGFSMRDSSDVWYRYLVTGVPDYYVDSRVGVDYAVIPALLDFHFGRGEMFYLNTGPYFAARLNARCTGTATHWQSNIGSYKLEETTINDDITALVRNNDFGWVAGFGVALPLSGNARLDLGLQYRQGFTEVFNAEYAGVPEPDDANDVFMRNSAFTVQAGLRIPLYRGEMK